MAKFSESVVRILPAEEIIARGAAEPEPFIWPQRNSWFVERSMRFKQLARQSESMSGYLELMAELAAAQHHVLQEGPTLLLPSSAALEQAAQRGLPPLAALDWQRDPQWHILLHQLVDCLLAVQMKGTAADSIYQVLQQVKTLSHEAIETQAEQLLAGSMSGVEVAVAPFIGAALQVYWVHLVCALPIVRTAELYQQVDVGAHTTCPCCGSLPTSSMVHSFGGMAGQRYVVCSLCGVQWHMPRIRCTRCLAEEGVDYVSLAPTHMTPEDYHIPAVFAERCAGCHTYLKIIHTEREPFADPLADELASIQLDILLGEQNYYKHGLNFLLLFS